MDYTVEDVKRVVCTAARAGIDAKDLLTEIDSRLGDGDMGVTVENGATALIETVQTAQGRDIGEFLLSCASSLARAAPSTMGTLISCGILSVAKSWRGQTALTKQEAVSAAKTMAEAIRFRGKAQVGDKTVLDALVPFAETLQTVLQECGSMKRALCAARDSARIGMENTKGMTAKTGRAKWLQDRNADCPDGGAMLCVIVAEAFVE